MSTAASNMNHAVVTKIMDAIRDITDEKVTAQDIYYVKYQLLKNNDSYEIATMNNNELKEKIRSIIGI